MPPPFPGDLCLSHRAPLETEARRSQGDRRQGKRKKRVGAVQKQGCHPQPPSIGLDAQPCHSRSPGRYLTNPGKVREGREVGVSGRSLSWRTSGESSLPTREMLCAPDNLNLPSGLGLPLCDLDLADLQNSVSGLCVPNCNKEGLVPPRPRSVLGLRGKVGRILSEPGQI